jgi:hypothetical protein
MTPLRQRRTEDRQVRKLSPRTQDSYLLQVSLFARHFGQPPDRLGPEQIRISTSKVCSTTSPLDLLPRPDSNLAPPAAPAVS